MTKFKKCVLALIMAGSVVGCSKVPAGYAGVKVNLLGDSKGIDTQELGTGRYWVGMNEELYLFPLYTQSYVWTKANNEGSESDESITFQTKEGLTANADLGISYHIERDKVTKVFQKYRKGVDEITSVFLHNMVRDALNTEASKLPMEAVYGAGKAALLSSAQQDVQEQVKDIGIIIEKISWVGQIRLPASVEQSINAKIQATQKTQQRENEIAQSKAEAQKQIAAAFGEAESTRLKAEAAAKAKLVQGEAEAKALQAKADVLAKNPQLVELVKAEAWNGQLPTTMLSGNAGTLVNLK